MKSQSNLRLMNITKSNYYNKMSFNKSKIRMMMVNLMKIGRLSRSWPSWASSLVSFALLISSILYARSASVRWEVVKVVSQERIWKWVNRINGRPWYFRISFRLINNQREFSPHYTGRLSISRELYRHKT